jgi:hypothetical protein
MTREPLVKFGKNEGRRWEWVVNRLVPAWEYSSSYFRLIPTFENASRVGVRITDR